MDAVHEVLLDVVPDAAGGFEDTSLAGELKGIEEADDRFGLRPAFLARSMTLPPLPS